MWGNLAMADEPTSGPGPEPKRSPAEHLKDHRFQKGKSGNPAGRPKGRTVTTALRELSQTEHNGKVLVDLVAERIMKEALQGKHAFVKELLERLEGKVPDKALIETKGQQKVYICPSPRVIGESEPAKPLALDPAPDEPGPDDQPEDGS
jgi:hypothetical protein